MESPKKEPKGIGGWLILPAIGLILTPLRIGVDLYRELLPALAPGVWNALTQRDSPAYHPLWGPLIAFEVVANVAIIIFTLWLVWLFFTKSKRLPRLIILWIVVITVVPVVDNLLSAQIPAVAATQPFYPDGAKDLVRSLLSAAIWIPYFIRSRRVKNTFIEPVSQGTSD